jgi:hypothetical protein
MTKPEHEALIAKHNALRAESASGSLKQRATRSDKGSKRKKTAEKEGTGRVPPTSRATIAGAVYAAGSEASLLTATATPTPAVPTATPVVAAPVVPTAVPVVPTATPAVPTATPVDPAQVVPTTTPVDPAQVVPTAPPVDPTATPIDPMAFDMHMDPAVLEELLRMPPYEGPLISLDFDGVNSDMHLFSIPQCLPAPITDDLPILPRPELSPPASPVPTPNVLLDHVLNSLEGLGATFSSYTAGSLRRDRDDDGSSSGAPPAKKVRKQRSDKGVRRGENRPPAPAPQTKPRKTRSDKGVRRGPRA